jgi:hypothetical protein
MILSRSVFWHGCDTAVLPSLFVPKPSRGADSQDCDISDLGRTVRRCPLASTAVGGDCYSLGYSVTRVLHR